MIYHLPAAAALRSDPMVDQDMPTPTGRASSLRWQLFGANAAVLTVATAALILTPVRVSSEPALAEAVVLAGGLAVMLALQLLLLRRALAPLRTLADVMGEVDLREPGRRLPASERGAAEIAVLTDAFNAMLERLEHERADSARRALAAQEDERVRIARELHDQVGQTLTALTLQAERAAQMRPADPALVARVADAALQALDDLRRIGRELRPEALDDLGLGNALITLCRRMSAPSGVRVVPTLEPGLPALAPETELVVYRIAQEAVTNALRHARAERVDLELTAHAGEVQLTVRDDGIGMPGEVRPGAAGLTGMRERALLVEGRLALRTPPGGGTEVVLVVPARDLSG